MASSGAGTTPHLAVELFKRSLGVDLVHVPYRGAAPMVTDLVGGQVQVWFGDVPSGFRISSSAPSGRLAVTTAARSPRCPICLAIAETISGL